jgi:hypothetical protein
MPVSFVWHDPEQTIIRFHVRGQWTWEEATAAVDQAALLCAARPHQIFDSLVIGADDEALGYLPEGAVTYLPTLVRRAAPNSGYMVLVLRSGNPLAKTLHKTLLVISSAYRQHVGMVDTLDEAEHLLAEKRAERTRKKEA